MYRESDLQTCIFGLVGWRQNQNPEYSTLPPSLTATASGLYFQDDHPLVNIENLDQALKNYSTFTYPAYTEDAAYAVGDKVRYSDNKVYEALTAIAEAPAVLNAPDWSEVNLFAQKLEYMTKAAVTQLTSAMFTRKKLDHVVKSIFENIQLFSGVGDIMNKELKQGRFVGYAVSVDQQRDLAAVISRLGTQFSLANPAFTLYVWHSSQQRPLKTIELNIPRYNAFTWSTIDVVLNSVGASTAPGGLYYIGYFEDDLVGQAVNRGYDFSGPPQCTTCNNHRTLYDLWSQFVHVTPFSVPAAYLESDEDGPLLWDPAATQWEYTKTFGLNVDVSVICDVTDLMCRTRKVFADALLKQVTYNVLSELAYNTRNNVIAKEVRDKAMYALGDLDGKLGVQTKLNNAIDALSFDYSDLNSQCMPCDSGAGIAYQSF